MLKVKERRRPSTETGASASTTAPFRIHIDSAHEIHALVPVKDGGPRSIALEWSLSRGGHELVRRSNDVYGGGNWVGRFTPNSGVYVLNLEVAGDDSHFLAGDSELEVYEAGDNRSANNDRVIQAFMILLLLCPIATTVIVLEVRAQRRARERLLAMANSLTKLDPISATCLRVRPRWHHWSRRSWLRRSHVLG